MTEQLRSYPVLDIRGHPIGRIKLTDEAAVALADLPDGWVFTPSFQRTKSEYRFVGLTLVGLPVTAREVDGVTAAEALAGAEALTQAVSRSAEPSTDGGE